MAITILDWKSFAVGFTLGAATITLIGLVSGPRSYEECVLESIQGVSSDLATRAIVGACMDKFPLRR